MNKMKLFEAIDLIDDDLIKEAEMPSEKLSDSSSNEHENAVTVSGVEVRSGIRWQRIAALASAFILIASFGAVGALLYKNRPPRQIEPSEIIIPAATESTTETTDKQSESTEAATTNTQKTSKAEKKETKESTNTVTTNKADNKPERDNCYAEDESNEPTAEDNTKPDEKAPEVTVTQPVIIPTTTAHKPVVTTMAKTTQKPVTTTAAKPTEPKATEPTTDTWVIHLPCTKTSNISWNAYQCPEMFEILRSIQYTPGDDRGMCNTYLIDDDDNHRIYALNFEDKWVMKFGQDGTDWGYASMPDRLYELFCGS
jgi:hypothetical protein